MGQKQMLYFPSPSKLRSTNLYIYIYIYIYMLDEISTSTNLENDREFNQGILSALVHRPSREV